MDWVERLQRAVCSKQSLKMTAEGQRVRPEGKGGQDFVRRCRPQVDRTVRISVIGSATLQPKAALHHGHTGF